MSDKRACALSRAATWIDVLELQKHPEGGWYREIYRASEQIPVSGLPSRFDGERAFCTSIYFLLAGDEFSALHRIRQDELWHFYDGDGLTVHVITPDGVYSEKKLGRNPERGDSLMHVVETGHWFGASVSADGFALVGCTVAPGFDFADFELPSGDELLALYPHHEALIRRLTR
ncbi:cupin domain-containing protein [Mariprofundus erugo]|uniref:Cupin domain-containing protein n=1 Tax=Mariprofundus erugo TaxID=2528639 RepID=A0A5R9GPP3_9PROT|nr:cupin domain-containing protein [Mariprofundus erugo]TLS67940.1 cupin domain-containing protein [Mariprofundus erugo]